MKLVLIIGSGAVGKMTVGQRLMNQTKLRLFHNHMMIEPVIDIFGKFDGKVIGDLRKVIFEHFVKSDNEGLIFTYMWAFDMPSDYQYINSVVDIFKNVGAEIYCVELVCDQSIRLKRNQTENRLENKKSKRNIVFSESLILREDSKYRLESKEGEIPFSNYIKIDNSHLSPDEVVEMIIDKFGFERI